MIKITIEADTAQEAGSELQALAGLLAGTSTVAVRGEQKPIEELTQGKPAGRKPKAATPAPEPEAASPDVPSDETDADLLAPVEKAPAGAAQVVDAGTGKPAAQQVVEATATEVKQMTIDEVKKSAALLAQKDTAKLKALIEKHGGTNLSSIPPTNLGNFAADVLAELG